MDKMVFRFTLGILLVFLSCSAQDIAFPPPPDNATFADVFPAEIDGLRGEARRLEELGGTEVLYGLEGGDYKMYIYAVRAENNESANTIFEKEFAPVFNQKTNHFTGQVDGNWQGSATEEIGRRWFAWVNGRWLFVINGKNQDYYQKVIQAFAFIQ